MNVFCLPHFPAGITVPLAAAIERRPVTKNSRAIIITTIQAGTRPSCTKATRMAETNTLSAGKNKEKPGGGKERKGPAPEATNRAGWGSRKNKTIALKKTHGVVRKTRATT